MLDFSMLVGDNAYAQKSCGGNDMNKTDLIAAMAEKSGLSKKDCAAALDAFTGSVEDAL